MHHQFGSWIISGSTLPSVPGLVQKFVSEKVNPEETSPHRGVEVEKVLSGRDDWGLRNGGDAEECKCSEAGHLLLHIRK